MVELLTALSDTPIPTILIVGGLLFLLLAIADKVHGELRVSPQNRKYALASGLVLLAAGVAIETGVSGAPPPERKAGLAAVSGDDWRSWTFQPTANPSIRCVDYYGWPKENSDPWSDVLCMNLELAKADRRLKDQFLVYLAYLPPEDAPDAKEAQRDWVFERNAACPAAWRDLESAVAVEGLARCLTDQTATRIAFYRDATRRLTAESDGE